jgi:hypothetical protein
MDAKTAEAWDEYEFDCDGREDDGLSFDEECIQEEPCYVIRKRLLREEMENNYR